MKDIREIVVVSGKGGTGKTTVTAALASVHSRQIIVDADVDAANLHILMKPTGTVFTDFRGRDVARVDTQRCSGCGICAELCRFGALRNIDNKTYRVDETLCEGCTLCVCACPEGAVDMVPAQVGQWMVSRTAYGDFVHARLEPGGENSGHLVTMVRHQAKLLARRKGINTILIDGPPGIGCAVNAALSGTDYALLVTEPTHTGIHDLERLLQLIRHFTVPVSIVINRYDINLNNTRFIESLAGQEGIPVIARIPHSYDIITAVTEAEIPVDRCAELKEAVADIWAAVKARFTEKGFKYGYNESERTDY